MFHYRKNLKKYKNYPKSAVCQFCEEKIFKTAVEETKYAFVVPNRIFYDLWELRAVTDHLMIIPRRHVKSLHELNKLERADIIDLMCKYENQNYNVYARSKDSKQRSVGHQHTHLIKTHDKQARGLLNLQRPYVFIKF